MTRCENKRGLKQRGLVRYRARSRAWAEQKQKKNETQTRVNEPTDASQEGDHIQPSQQTVTVDTGNGRRGLGGRECARCRLGLCEKKGIGETRRTSHTRAEGEKAHTNQAEYVSEEEGSAD